MTVGWINKVVNNTDHEWWLKYFNNGASVTFTPKGGNPTVILAGNVMTFDPNTTYYASGFTIPWYGNGTQYIEITAEVFYMEFYQTSRNGKNWVYYENKNSLIEVKQEVPGTGAPIIPYSCTLQLLNYDGKSDINLEVIQDALHTFDILEAAGKWSTQSGIDLFQAIAEAYSGASGAAGAKVADAENDDIDR